MTQHPVPNCLEVARNGRFCIGAEEAAAEISRLTAAHDALAKELEEANAEGQRRCACEFEEGATRPTVECLVHRTWRRVGSELPPLAGPVLAYYPTLRSTVGGPVQRVYYSPNIMQPWGGSSWDGTPTHWMPLPAAPTIKE